MDESNLDVHGVVLRDPPKASGVPFAFALKQKDTPTLVYTAACAACFMRAVVLQVMNCGTLVLTFRYSSGGAGELGACHFYLFGGGGRGGEGGYPFIVGAGSKGNQQWKLGRSKDHFRVVCQVPEKPGGTEQILRLPIWTTRLLYHRKPRGWQHRPLGGPNMSHGSSKGLHIQRCPWLKQTASFGLSFPPGKESVFREPVKFAWVKATVELSIEREGERERERLLTFRVRPQNPT